VSARDHHRDDVGAYLLGALTDSERRAFEAHVAGCGECREEVEWLRPAADSLPRSVEPVRPPPALKAALMKEVRRSSPRPSRLERLRSRPRPRLRPRPTMAWAGAAAALVVGVLGGLGLAQALSGDDVRTVTAAAGQGSPRAGATLTVAGDGEKGAILRVSGLPKPSGGDVYQAWVQRGATMTPEPTFEVTEDGRGAVAVPDDLSDADAVLVTRERRGGSRVPSGAPLLRVGL
jgi:anti-sigma-K factor RskA